MKVNVDYINWLRPEGMSDEDYAALPQRLDVDIDIGHYEDTPECNDRVSKLIDKKLEEKYKLIPDAYLWDDIDAEQEANKSNDELIRDVLHKYFEGYEEYDPNFSAQDAIDEIAAIVDL